MAVKSTHTGGDIRSLRVVKSREPRLGELRYQNIFVNKYLFSGSFHNFRAALCGANDVILLKLELETS